MLKLSSRVNHLKPSATLEISARAAQLQSEGKDVISLAAGEPDFNTPDSIQAAATEAMARGITRYTPAAGFLSLREMIAEKVSCDNNFPVKSSEVIVTCGAKHALYLALQCLVEEDDFVLVPTPAWVSYQAMIELAGAKVFPLPLFEEDGFCANVDRWKGMSIPPNARGIILNSPNNPTGVVTDKKQLTRLVSWALQRNLWILADEVYEKILYDGATHTSVASLGPEVAAHTITVSSVSKTYAMTGWRVGWAIAPEPLIKKMSALASQSTSNVTSFAQVAATTALKLPHSYIDDMVKIFERRRNYCLERLQKFSKVVTFVKPQGAFYFFLNINKWLADKKMSDLEFCKLLLEEAHIGLVPGAAFGQTNYVRMSYATSDENLKRAFDRLEAFMLK
ncbi:MAG: pyridoxal phosphate-dependent aminotransferase [Bdellovibrionaceae bacterium]|nr:pyridoxal phosphate-dependent aminotransferase [Bdellovibrionales bacterium]MCB9255004.1 pyridoxal phosphate-dependent aminotransferase [Pseudobdellovibrionaceae bacterium]